MSVPKSILSHSQRVCRLYKSAYRALEEHAKHRWMFRLEAVELRAKFDATRKEQDMRKLAAMVQAGEEEVFANRHLQPLIFKNDPEGICYHREDDPFDVLVDYWHPWEKAQFIDYFETREKRKSDYEEYYKNSIMKKGLKDWDNLEYPAPTNLL